jgi:hypothetical protein
MQIAKKACFSSRINCPLSISSGRFNQVHIFWLSPTILRNSRRGGFRVVCVHERSAQAMKGKARNPMICYRVAIRGKHSNIWHWKSPPFNSLHGVLGVLKLYRTLPEEHIRVFLFTSTQHMDAMLQRANQGALSTAIAVKQLCDAHYTSWIEIRRLEVELGEGGDHDQPYDKNLTPSSSQTLAWTKLLVRRARGELSL